MYIGLGTVVVILIVVLVIYMVQRDTAVPEDSSPRRISDRLSCIIGRANF